MKSEFIRKHNQAQRRIKLVSPTLESLIDCKRVLIKEHSQASSRTLGLRYLCDNFTKYGPDQPAPPVIEDGAMDFLDILYFFFFRGYK